MNTNEYSLKEYPITSVIAGFGLIAGGFYSYFESRQWFIVGALLLLGLLALLFAFVLEIKGDSTTRTLSISRRGLIQRYYREFSFNEISTIQLGSRRSTDDDGRSSTNYRIEINLKNGEMVPIRKNYSGGRRGKEKKASELREFIGVGGMDSSMGGMFNAAMEMAKQTVTPQMREEQESITGDQDQIHERDGIRWQLKTLGFGSMAIARWNAIDYFLPPTRFLYLVQKREGQIEIPSVGFLDTVQDKLFSQSLKVYGFGEKDAPNAANALQPKLENQLGELFLAHASDEVLATHILNAQTKALLVDWATKHPAGKDTSEQMAILFSPTGLYLTMPGYLNAEYLDELAGFGSKLFLAQT